MRESPVASEKIAVDQASRRPAPGSSTGVEFRVALGRARPVLRLCYDPARPLSVGPFYDAEHQATRAPREDGRTPAAREPALPVDDQDADAPTAGRCRG